MKFCYNTNFTLPKQSQRSRSILPDGSRSLSLFWKEKTLSYNQRNTVFDTSDAEFNKSSAQSFILNSDYLIMFLKIGSFSKLVAKYSANSCVSSEV